MWIEGNAYAIKDEFFNELDQHMSWLELDGHQVDFNIAYFEDHSDIEVEVYVDEQFVGVAAPSPLGWRPLKVFSFTGSEPRS